MNLGGHFPLFGEFFRRGLASRPSRVYNDSQAQPVSSRLPLW